MRDPYDLAAQLLSQVTSLMTDAGVTLPKTQYVAPGQSVAYDGPQVTTNVLRVFAGEPGAQDQYAISSSVMVFSGEFLVVIVRDTPVIQEAGDQVIPPTLTALKKNSQEVLLDLQRLTEALITIVSTNLLGTRGMPVVIGPVSTVGPEGGVVATTAQITIPLI